MYHISMEDDLKNAMRIIDKHSDKMPDGDYLELCNIMRDMYRAEADDETEPISARSLFPEGLTLEDIAVDNDTRLHYYTDCENMMRSTDIQLKEDEIKLLDKKIRGIKMLRRMTPTIMREAIKHYYEVHFIYLDDYTAETFEAMVGTRDQLMNICRSYMEMQNRFKSMYRRNLNLRCVKIGEEIHLIRQGFI